MHKRKPQEKLKRLMVTIYEHWGRQTHISAPEDQEEKEVGGRRGEGEGGAGEKKKEKKRKKTREK